MTPTFPEVLKVFDGSDGEATKGLYARLEAIGVAGVVAVNLFRACKTSERAKHYRGGIPGRGSYRRMAYDRKQWSLDNLCKVLAQNGQTLGIGYGWGRDPGAKGYENVLYVEIPTGQVSFHSPVRGEGPEFKGTWDGQRGASPTRILIWCAQLIDQVKEQQHGPEAREPIPGAGESVPARQQAGGGG